MATSVHVYVNNCWGRTIDQKCVYGLVNYYRIDNTLWPATASGTVKHHDMQVSVNDPRMAVYSNGMLKYDGEIVSSDNALLRVAVMDYIRNNHLSVEKMRPTRARILGKLLVDRVRR